MIIPKKIHFFWAGTYMSWMRYMTLYSFRKLHPDWEMFLHIIPVCFNVNQSWQTGNIQDSYYYVGENYFNKLNDLKIVIKEIDLNIFRNIEGEIIHKCDIFEWKVLHTLGGIFSDLDILFIKPIDLLYEQFKDSDIILCYNDYFSIGYMGGQKNNLFYKNLYENAFRNFDKENYQSTGATNIYQLLRSGGINLSIDYLQILRAKYPYYRIFNLSQETFYPFDYNNIGKIFEEQTIDQKTLDKQTLPNQTLGIHWFGGSPIIQQWNELLNENNYKDFNNLFYRETAKIK